MSGKDNIDIEKLNIGIVALDLDGTTLLNDHDMSVRTKLAFRRALDMGVHIVIATGRTFASLPEVLFSLEGLEYVITSNGAHITELATNEKIYENIIGPEAVAAVAEAVRDSGYQTEAFIDGVAYINEDLLREFREHGSTFRDVEYVLNTRHPVPNIYDFMIEHADNVENISINFEFREEKEAFREKLDKIDGITVTSSFAHNFEIGGITTSKATAVKWLMQRLGLSAKNLLACGDSPNDIEMIKLAEVGVAMENAEESTRETADHITKKNTEDGVAIAIERFVFKE